MAAKLSNSPLLKVVTAAGAVILLVIIMVSLFGGELPESTATNSSNSTKERMPVSQEPSQAEKDTMSEDIRELTAQNEALKTTLRDINNRLSESDSGSYSEETVQALVDATVQERLKNYEEQHGQKTVEVDPGSTNMEVDRPVDDVIAGDGADSGELSFDDSNDVALSGYKVEGAESQSASSEKVEWIMPDGVQSDESGGLVDGVVGKGKDQLFGGSDGSASEKQQAESIHYATLDMQAILFDAMLISDMVGVVPKDSGVSAPYQFKIELGQSNFATSGVYLPHLAKMRMSGYAVGEWSKGCVRGYITAATFVFEDGTIHSVGGNKQQGNGGHIAYVTNEYGDPCIKGEKVSNLEEYAAISGGLSGLGSVGEAIASQQFNVSEDGSGGLRQAFTGDVAENAAGSGLSGGLETVNQAIAERYRNVRDLIVARSNQHVTIHLNQQMNIDYDPEGRKVINPDFEQEVEEYYATQE